MTDSVVSADFGKGKRESARAFARLLGICEKQSADILARPERYLDQAAAEICRLRGMIREAQDALRRPPANYCPEPDEPIFEPIRTVVVIRDEWDRLRKCARIVEDRDHD